MKHPPVTMVATVAREPVERLRRLVQLADQQDYAGAKRLVIAAPPDELDEISAVGNEVDLDVEVVGNPSGERSRGLNCAIAAAEGMIVRLDSRSMPPPDYVSRVVDRLMKDPVVGIVGGIQRPVATSGSVIGRGIARALANRAALGGAAYRTLGEAGAVDTVYLGAFRRHDVLDLGGYDEGLLANEDFDLCARFSAAGRTVWLEPGVVVAYEARDRLGELARQYFAFGRSKAIYWRSGRGRPNARQGAALAGGAAAAIAVLLVAGRRSRVAGALLVGAVGALALDLHNPERGASPAVRAVSAGSIVLIDAAWFAGVISGYVQRRRSIRQSPASAPAPPWPTPRPPRRP